ncbi:type II secretion system secretin GspD [Massilia sp. Leaf139]|uniref:type II secretion system secretin GspD n=1 Tax=Massilia sp. Leaf139 TaxID=1736272 RepID=UPI0009E8ABE3|nr:type II secretion system secretin GspD [Massilia sp. Leaf139]
MKTSFRSTPEFSAVRSTSHPALRRIAAGVMLCCAVATALPPAPAFAQENAAALSFVNADIESVIKAVGHYTGMTFIIDPRVKGTLTLVSEKSLTKSQAFGLLTSALRLQGFAVVTTGEGYAKVVPEAEAKLQSSPTQVGKRGTRVQGDQIATQIFHLSYESAANLTAVLRPLISPNNSIMANPGNNSLVITDYADNLRRLSRIIAALDAPVAADLDVVPIRNGIASDIATLVSRLMEPAAGGDSGRVTILADARTNSVVVRAPSQARANLAKSLIAKLDQATSEKGNIHVVYLKNADASKVAQTLRAVVSQDASAVPVQQQGTAGGSIQAGAAGGTGGGLGGGQQGQQGLGAGGSSSNYSQQGQATAGGAGGGAGSGFIQADASTNSLIITAPDAIYRNLRGVIDQLDVRRAQVYIEALVVEMNTTKAAEFGVQWLGLSGSDTSKYRVGAIQGFKSNSANNIVNLAAAARAGVTGESGPPSLPGLTLGIFKQINGELGLGAVASALENEGAANVLSTPNMITLDNELATIKVGRNIPILTGSFTTAASGSTNPFQTVDRKDIGLLMKVRPQISEGGVIKLSIYHENSDIDETLDRPEGIVTTLRAIESNVLADDGQIIVLGGLISDDENHQQEKVRGLGDIPVLGNLFKYRTRTREKTNLMVFLRPVVVRSKEQNNSISLDRYEYMRALGVTTQPQDDTVLLRSLGAPELPPLTNGQPPAGGTMATQPPPAPPPVRPGAATGAGVTQPAAPQSQQNQAPVPQFRPVTPPNQK